MLTWELFCAWNTEEEEVRIKLQLEKELYVTRRVKEFGGSLDFNIAIAIFMENGMGAFHNHEHSTFIWANTPLTACLLPDIYAAGALSAAPSLQIANATSCVI